MCVFALCVWYGFCRQIEGKSYRKLLPPPAARSAQAFGQFQGTEAFQLCWRRGREMRNPGGRNSFQERFFLLRSANQRIILGSTFHVPRLVFFSKTRHYSQVVHTGRYHHNVPHIVCGASAPEQRVHLFTFFYMH
ncbi:unnamed protein product [Pylaiella littoralis]